jgi:hypothetical protein
MTDPIGEGRPTGKPPHSGPPTHGKPGDHVHHIHGLKGNPQLVIGGIAISVVVLAALLSKRAAADPSSGVITPGSQGTYDSTANDVYASLMDTMGKVQDQVNALNATPATPTPTPSTPPAGIGPFDHYVRDAAGAIFGITAHGKSTHLGPAQYKALGSPAYRQVRPSLPQRPKKPVPLPQVIRKPKKAGNYDHYVRDSLGAIWGITAHGNKAHLSPSEYKALGRPAYRQTKK